MKDVERKRLPVGGDRLLLEVLFGGHIGAGGKRGERSTGARKARANALTPRERSEQPRQTLSDANGAAASAIVRDLRVPRTILGGSSAPRSPWPAR